MPFPPHCYVFLPKITAPCPHGRRRHGPCHHRRPDLPHKAGIVGTDVNSGLQRYTFGVPELSDGIGFVTLAMGVFGFAEIIVNLQQKEEREVFTKSVSGLWLTWKEFKQVLPPIARGTGIGSHVGSVSANGSWTASVPVAASACSMGSAVGPTAAGRSTRGGASRGRFPSSSRRA